MPPRALANPLKRSGAAVATNRRTRKARTGRVGEEAKAAAEEASRKANPHRKARKR